MMKAFQTAYSTISLPLHLDNSFFYLNFAATIEYKIIKEKI